MKCRTPQACPFWSLPNNVKRQLYWTVLLNACSLFKYCLMMLVVVRPLKLPAGSSYATFKGLWFCYLCYRVCPASVDMWTHRSRLLSPDVWCLGDFRLGTTGREPAEACLAEPKARITQRVLHERRVLFFEQRELEDLQIPLWWSLIDFL